LPAHDRGSTFATVGDLRFWEYKRTFGCVVPMSAKTLAVAHNVCFRDCARLESRSERAA